MYAVPVEQGHAHFLITNKHVVEEATQITLSGVQGDGERPLLGQPAEVSGDSDFASVWTAHPDERVDVAAAPFWAVTGALAARGQSMFFKTIAPELCLTEERARELDATEDVIFAGYPSGIYDRVNLLPVVRRGSAASPVSVDYNGLPAFLVDASVFPGSSGSPVFLADTGMYRNRAGGMVMGARPPLCLGVLAAVHVRTVEGTVTELATSVGVTFDEPIDLGIVFKSSTFDACVDPILEKTGLRRSASPASDQPQEDVSPG